MTESRTGDTGNDLSELHDEAELLFRQVHPNFIDDGEPSSQAFRPTTKDQGKLSVSRSSKTSPENAFRHHTETLKLKSGGSWAVSVGEALGVQLHSFDDPLRENPAHAFVDFRQLSRRDAEARSKVLLAHARVRGCLYRP